MKHRAIPELTQIEALVEAGGSPLETRVLAEIDAGGKPAPAAVFDHPRQPDPAPRRSALRRSGIGLERIGADVVIAYLRHLAMRLRWDSISTGNRIGAAGVHAHR